MSRAGINRPPTVPIEVVILDSVEVPVYLTIGQKARQLRELGTSDKAIARSLGVSDKTVGKSIALAPDARWRSEP